MNTTTHIIEEYKNNPIEAIKQLESCKYECEAGILENNVAFIALKELIIENYCE